MQRYDREGSFISCPEKAISEEGKYLNNFEERGSAL